MIQRFTAFRRNLSKLVDDGKVGHTQYQRNADDEPQYEGVIWSDGTVTLRWRTAAKSTSVFNSLRDMLNIHGHPEYGTDIVWHDQPMPPEWEHQLVAFAEKALAQHREMGIADAKIHAEYSGTGGTLSLLQIVVEADSFELTLFPVQV